MNDLNSLVTHALSAVRDAQQSVRDGDVAAGDEATPLLANFADVMQGLIALAQTAPQTEDAFDYAQTAMLRNLAEEQEDGEAASVDLAEANDAENVDGAADILLEEDDSTEAPALSPLAAAFAPLQETIASLMMLQVPQNTSDAAGAGSVVDHVVQAAQLTTQPVSAPMLQAEPTKAEAAQPATDAAQAQAANANAASHVQDAQTVPAAPVAQDTQTVPQNLQAAAPAPMAAAQAMHAATDAGTTEPSAPAPAARMQAPQPAQAPAPAFDRVQLGQDAAAQPEAPANAPQLPSAELGPQAPVEVQPQTAEMTEAMAPPSATSPVALEQVQAAQAVPLEVAAPSKPAEEGASKADAPKVDAAAAARAAAAKSRPAQRASSTIAERQAARHMQNYQQAMQEQVSVPAAPAPVAAGAMVTHFAPPAAAIAPVVDAAAAAEQTVQLPAVALPNLPADLSNALAAGAKRVRIEINPPSLGNVEVGVHMRDGAVFVSMQAENANVAQHIERHLQDLRTHLKDAGLSLGGFEMSARGDEAGHQQPHSGTSSQERLWSDDMLQLATGNSPLNIEDVPTPVISQQRPGSINVIA